MSHVVNIDLEIRDLDALEQAGKALGMELHRGQTRYKFFGTHVGDYPLPKGFTAADMGHCDHALSIKDNPNAYEVGVCRRRDGKEGYLLQFDFYGGGRGLMNTIGDEAFKLRNEYISQVSIGKMRAKGFRVMKVQTAEGKIVLRATR